MRSKTSAARLHPARSGVRAAAILVVAHLAGCSGPVRVQVETRLTPETDLWPRLDGPRYAIHGPDPTAEASLGFEGLAVVLQRAVEAERPTLRRVPPGETANLVLGMGLEVIDRGIGVHSYPVYGRVYGYRRYGPYGPACSYGGLYYAGDRVESYHLGFLCRLSATAWISDRGAPAGRRVLWEGMASTVSDDPHPEAVMPYLAAALAEFYGKGTGGTEVVKLNREDDRVLAVAGTVVTTQPVEHRSRDRERRSSSQPADDSHD